MTFLFGQGGWIWWHGALALTFVMLLGVAVYAWCEPKGMGTGMLMFMVFCLAWVPMLVFSTVDVVLWSVATQGSWGMRVLFVVIAWIAVGLLWTFLFMATNPNYPERLLRGKIFFTALCAALYAANLWMLHETHRS